MCVGFCSVDVCVSPKFQRKVEPAGAPEISVKLIVELHPDVGVAEKFATGASGCNWTFLTVVFLFVTTIPVRVCD